MPTTKWGNSSTKDQNPAFFCPSDKKNYPGRLYDLRFISYNGLANVWRYINNRAERYGGSGLADNRTLRLRDIRTPADTIFTVETDDAKIATVDPWGFVPTQSAQGSWLWYRDNGANTKLRIDHPAYSMNYLFFDGHIDKERAPNYPPSLTISWCQDH